MERSPKHVRLSASRKIKLTALFIIVVFILVGFVAHILTSYYFNPERTERQWFGNMIRFHINDEKLTSDLDPYITLYKGQDWEGRYIEVWEFHLKLECDGIYYNEVVYAKAHRPEPWKNFSITVAYDRKVKFTNNTDFLIFCLKKWFKTAVYASGFNVSYWKTWSESDNALIAAQGRVDYQYNQFRITALITCYRKGDVYDDAHRIGSTIYNFTSIEYKATQTS